MPAAKRKGAATSRPIKKVDLPDDYDIELPQKLSDLLLKDNEIMKSNTMLLNMPPKKTIDKIFDEFLKSNTELDPGEKKKLMTKVKFVLTWQFNYYLQMNLLYKFELVQYLEALNRFRKKKKLIAVMPQDYFQHWDENIARPPKTVLRKRASTNGGKDDVWKYDTSEEGNFTDQYGVVHFLRFCNFAPWFLENNVMSIPDYECMKDTIEQVIDFIDANLEDYFDESEYQVASDDYQRQYNAHMPKDK